MLSAHNEQEMVSSQANWYRHMEMKGKFLLEGCITLLTLVFTLFAVYNPHMPIQTHGVNIVGAALCKFVWFPF